MMMALISVRKPHVSVRANIPVRQLYERIVAELSLISDQQADAFAADACYALTRDELLDVARRYVVIDELPSA